MESIENFDPTGAFTEAIKVLSRELHQSKEKIKRLENDISESRAASSSADLGIAKSLAERAEVAEALVAKLKQDLAKSENSQSKLNLKIERLRSQINMYSVKQESDDEKGDDPDLFAQSSPPSQASTPSDSSSPVISSRRSKRKEGPATSIEHLNPKKLKVSQTRASRQLPPFTSSHSLEEQVLRVARFLFRASVVTEDAYPKDSKNLAKECWIAASAQYQAESIPNPPTYKISVVASRMRSSAKMKARSLVEPLYGISKASPKPETQAKVKNLLDGNKYIYKDPVKRTGVYQHPAIHTLIRDTWLCSSKQDGLTYDEFSDGGKGVPLPAIALVLTAIHGALDEWASGQREDVEFRFIDYQARYEKHLENLKELEKRTSEEQIIPRLRKHWLKMAMVPPNPAPQTLAGSVNKSVHKKPDTSLTAEDVENVKAEWKDMDLDDEDDDGNISDTL